MLSLFPPQSRPDFPRDLNWKDRAQWRIQTDTAPSAVNSSSLFFIVNTHFFSKVPPNVL